MSNVFKVYNLLSDTTDILTDVAEKAAGIPQTEGKKFDLVWKNTRKMKIAKFTVLPLIYFIVAKPIKSET
jgi:hypothetical protein